MNLKCPVFTHNVCDVTVAASDVYLVCGVCWLCGLRPTDDRTAEQLTTKRKCPGRRRLPAKWLPAADKYRVGQKRGQYV